VNKNGTVILGITQYDYDAALKELGGLKEVLDQLLDVIGKKNISVEKVASTLMDMAKRYKELRTQVQSYTSDDPEIQALLSTAQKELEQGHFEETERLYNQVAKQIEEKLQNLQEIKDKRLFSAAEAKFANGKLKMIQLAYLDAAHYYQKAVELLPVKYEEKSGLYLNESAFAFHAAGQYSEAKPLFERSLAIFEKVLGKEHPDVASILNNLAGLYTIQGNYIQAKPLHERSLAIREKVLGKEHPEVAATLNNLAELHRTQGEFTQAEPLYKHSLAIFEKALGKEHPNVATLLDNLGMLYHLQGDYVQAKPLYERSLAIREKVLGKEHPDVASSLNNLGLLYTIQGNYIQAKPLYERSLAIREKVLGKEHPDVAISFNNFAELHRIQGNYAQAILL